MSYNQLPPKGQAIVDAARRMGVNEQMSDLLEYLPGLVENGHVPEGSIGALFNNQPPPLKALLAAMGEAAATPRDRPFVPKESPAERFESFGIPAALGTSIADALDSQYVAESLQSRMGTDQPDDSPLTLREQLAAAADFHEGSQDV